MKKHNTIIFLFIFCWMNTLLYAQEVRIFTVNDFDLKGDVKTCTVVTKYGKEEFDFDENGYLTKLVTRYSDLDYAVTYYKYDNAELIEKRVENYREGKFDEGTSIANFYQIDTTLQRKITETIFSYNEEPLDEYEYNYDADNRLISFKRTNNEGIDETIVVYNDYKGENTVSYLMDGVVQKSIRTSEKKGKRGLQKIVLTKDFLEGDPIKAFEEIYDADNKLISEVKFIYDIEYKEFTSEEKIIYRYNETGVLNSTITMRGEEEARVKEFIYQYDGSSFKNWVKEIITPDNTYTTRSVEYYLRVDITEED
ncbi:MAG: hypothetical protein COA50_13190 [Flavobacteriaceae bacterium]|nr:MAG: hypothetical protein COA50_13190 [Flavobacteriaceae bacterium]